MTPDGAADTLKPGGTADQAALFTARHQHCASPALRATSTARHQHQVVDAGHNLPQEAQAAFADTVPKLRAWTLAA